MADDFALALQKGIRAALVADAGVSALVGARVYDEPPQGATYPFVMFTDISPAAFDTDTAEGALVGIGLQVHSRSASGRVEAVRIVEAIKNALHRNEAAVTVTGFTLVELIFETYTSARDAEGRGYNATISLQAMLDTA